jgi:hypothetical protein
MIALADIDFASCPHLTLIRDVAGEKAVLALVKARGGVDIYLPETPTADCALVRIVGLEAAKRIVDALGSFRKINIPTGRGSGHSRRIDWARVVALHDVGMTRRKIAEEVGCTDRQVRNILRQELGRREDQRRRRERERLRLEARS